MTPFPFISAAHCSLVSVAVKQISRSGWDTASGFASVSLQRGAPGLRVQAATEKELPHQFTHLCTFWLQSVEKGSWLKAETNRLECRICRIIYFLVSHKKRNRLLTWRGMKILWKKKYRNSGILCKKEIWTEKKNIYFSLATLRCCNDLVRRWEMSQTRWTSIHP